MSNMLSILGSSLAQATGKEEGICRGLLRLSIQDSVEYLQETTDLAQVAAHIQTMTYQDWKNIIEGGVLAQRLANMGIAEPGDIVTGLKQTLAEKQSLLTMTAQ